MSFSSRLFKKETSQQRLTLDHSERLVLKELASLFLSVDFPGSQLEALVRARGMFCSWLSTDFLAHHCNQAPLAESNTDEITASILTPSPADLIPTELEVDADAQTIQPPLVPSPDGTANPTREPSTVPPSVRGPEPESVSNGNESHSGSSESTLVDKSFVNCDIDGTGSNEPLVVNNFSHCTGDTSRRVIKTSAFSNSTIKGATINNQSFNNDGVTFTNSRMTGPYVMNNTYRYS
jgi:hypothetical protein